MTSYPPIGGWDPPICRSIVRSYLPLLLPPLLVLLLLLVHQRRQFLDLPTRLHHRRRLHQMRLSLPLPPFNLSLRPSRLVVLQSWVDVVVGLMAKALASSSLEKPTTIRAPGQDPAAVGTRHRSLGRELPPHPRRGGHNGSVHRYSRRLAESPPLCLVRRPCPQYDSFGSRSSHQCKRCEQSKHSSLATITSSYRTRIERAYSISKSNLYYIPFLRFGTVTTIWSDLD